MAAAHGPVQRATRGERRHRPRTGCVEAHSRVAAQAGCQGADPVTVRLAEAKCPLGRSSRFRGQVKQDPGQAHSGA